MTEYFQQRCIEIKKNGETKIKKPHTKKLIRTLHPTFTNEERGDIFIEIEDQIIEQEIKNMRQNDEPTKHNNPMLQ